MQTVSTPMRTDLEPLPERMRNLRIDERGYPVPWFVAWVDDGQGGERPEFRAMDARKWRQAVKLKLCWVCGQQLGRWLAFPIGPMCAVNRVTAEPPSHRECAEWSIRNCPFLSQPQMVRRDEQLPEGYSDPAGFGIKRNPGVTCLWITRGYELFDDGRGKPLITIGEPSTVTWWKEKRAATRADVEESIDSGLTILMAAARSEGPFAVEQLGKMFERAQRWYPQHDDESAIR
jgi:hypothetical protein